METLLVALAALAAGAANAIAGGGSLLSFPALVATGMAKRAASVTNTVALCPGYIGATVAQRAQLAGQGRRIAMLVPTAAVGGAGGAVLLLETGDAVFAQVVPFLLLFAAALLGFQERIKRFLAGRDRKRHAEVLVLPLTLAASVYGGYFGAGMGVIVLAALAVVLDDDLVRLNALKQCVSLAANLTAMAVFVAVTDVAWTFVAAMAAASLAGGVIGGRLVSRIPPAALRWTVVSVALAVAARYCYALFE